jgi:asparagine synthase (glutamine-hydrolysing)
MCGISGILHYNKISYAAQRVQDMTTALKHRGPDAFGYYNDDHISLGHSRLSIIDLDARANQPMTDPSGQYTLVFNGEIYNFKELRSQLADYPFTSQSDSEVLLASLIRWELKALDKLEGMFAFAFWDKQKNELILARDRFGVKPLYYYHSGNQFIFASEQRALFQSQLIPRKLNNQSVSDLMQYQSCGYSALPIAGIQEVSAGHYLSITQQGLTSKLYYKIQSKKKSSTAQEASKQALDLLTQAVSKRMVSDVDMAAFLSGGIDSSAIVALMSLQSNKPINTFTLSFDDPQFDESDYAEIISKRFQTNHIVQKLNPDSLVAKIPEALDAMDNPTMDGINTFIISHAIKEAGFKVAMSGIGGDELFAGYPGFKYYKKLRGLKSVFNATYPIRKMALAFLSSNKSLDQRQKEILGLAKGDIFHFYPFMRSMVSRQQFDFYFKIQFSTQQFEKKMLEHKSVFEQLDDLSQYSLAEYLGYAQYTLLKDVDQMSMSAGLEIREPFFDHKLIEYVLSLPDELKQGSQPKLLLVKALDPLLPKEIINRPKKGFVIPWEKWLRRELSSFCKTQLDSLVTREFVKKQNVVGNWERFLKGEEGVKWTEIWSLVVLGYWLDKNQVN